MIELEALSKEAVPSALEMAKQYRQLSDPEEAESICLDILEACPENQEALITLILALTDRFSGNEISDSYRKAIEIVENLDSQYCKHYYTGIVFERRAKYHFRTGTPGSGSVAYSWYKKAMDSYESALTSCDPDNQDALLRWNSCARFINNHPELEPVSDDQPGMLLDAFETPH